MININGNLTVDDLIIEYIDYKIKNGYNPYFSTSEFITFLYYFENNMKVVDTLYDNEILFKRFFDRKRISDWNIKKDRITGETIYEPHLILENDIIKATYDFGNYDKSIITTYFMSEEKQNKIKKIIKEYLEDFPLREIDKNTEIKEDNLMLGKYVSALIINSIWSGYITYYTKYNEWPIQCKDIEKYLFETDLAKLINIESIKKELILFYKEIAERIAIMYQNDKNLEISNYLCYYLANANFKLITKDFEHLIKYCSINTFKIKINEIKENELYNYNKECDIHNDKNNTKVKKLVRNLENEYNMYNL